MLEGAASIIPTEHLTTNTDYTHRGSLNECPHWHVTPPPCDAVDTDYLGNCLSWTINITAFTNECHQDHYHSTIVITAVGNAG